MINVSAIEELNRYQKDIGLAVESGSWNELAELLSRRRAFLETSLSKEGEVAAMSESERKQLKQCLEHIMLQDQNWIQHIEEAKNKMQKQRLDFRRSRSSIKAYE